MKAHGACKLFPMIGEAEFEALKADIAENGQREPIVLVGGELVDGRNRLRACQELGIEPKVRNLSHAEAGDVFSLVMSLNFHRRHLKPHEKGAALAAYMERVGARQGKTGRPKKSDSVSDISETLPAVAQKLGIDERTARRHLKAAEDYAAAAPDLREKIDAGEITPKRARELTPMDPSSVDFDKTSSTQRAAMACVGLQVGSKDDSGISRAYEDAAKLWKTNKQWVGSAASLLRHAPDVFDDVMRGDISIRAAMAKLKERTGTRHRIVDNAAVERAAEMVGILDGASGYFTKVRVDAIRSDERLHRHWIEVLRNHTKLCRDLLKRLED